MRPFFTCIKYYTYLRINYHCVYPASVNAIALSVLHLNIFTCLIPNGRGVCEINQNIYFLSMTRDICAAYDMRHLCSL
jgi:hypothetical protein